MPHPSEEEQQTRDRIALVVAGLVSNEHAMEGYRKIARDTNISIHEEVVAEAIAYIDRLESDSP